MSSPFDLLKFGLINEAQYDFVFEQIDKANKKHLLPFGILFNNGCFAWCHFRNSWEIEFHLTEDIIKEKEKENEH